MEFKLKLVPALPGQLVLGAEKPYEGFKFLAEAAKCLRRSLDSSVRHRHQVMGPLHTYNVVVPQTIAMSSNFFETANERYVTVENEFLNDFIFHTAMYTYGKGNRCYYPFYQDEVVLMSFIDELAVVDTWMQQGYPETLTKVSSDPTVPENPDQDSPDAVDMNCMLNS